MKKIKILFWIVVCYTIITFFQLLFEIIYFQSYSNAHAIYAYSSFFGSLHILIINGIRLIILIAVIYLSRALFKILKTGYFNTVTFKSFYIAGLLLCLVALLDFIRAALEISVSFHEELQFGYIMLNGLLFLMGFGVLAISQIVKNGTLLKQENDLTI